MERFACEFDLSFGVIDVEDGGVVFAFCLSDCSFCRRFCAFHREFGFEDGGFLCVECAEFGVIKELALGYGGSVGALKAMGAIEMGLTEDELPELVSAWRQANPHIVKLWWDIDRAVKDSVIKKTTTEAYGLKFTCRSGMLFIQLPSGRRLAYVKPKIGENKFGGTPYCRLAACSENEPCP